MQFILFNVAYYIDNGLELLLSYTVYYCKCSHACTYISFIFLQYKTLQDNSYVKLLIGNYLAVPVVKYQSVN